MHSPLSDFCLLSEHLSVVEDEQTRYCSHEKLISSQRNERKSSSQITNDVVTNSSSRKLSGSRTSSRPMEQSFAGDSLLAGTRCSVEAPSSS